MEREPEHHWASECKLCGRKLGKVYTEEDIIDFVEELKKEVTK